MTRRTLCGVVESLDEHCILDPNDIVVISLCDTTLWDWTRIDFPHIPQRFILSHLKLDHCEEFPIPFTLYYNAEEIDGNLCYGIRCDILDQHEQLKYSTERFINVLTDKYPKTNVHLTVIPLRNSSKTRTTNDKNEDDDDDI